MLIIVSNINYFLKLYGTRLNLSATISRAIGVSGLDRAQSAILINLYLFLGILLIYLVIPIKFEGEYYMDILVNVGLKIGLFKYKFTSSNVYILLYSYRSILGFKVSILIFVVGLILIPILFMIDNYIFIILSLLSVIFVKAFMMNFYTKHFKLFNGSSKNINYTEIIKNILSNIEKL